MDSALTTKSLVTAKAWSSSTALVATSKFGRAKLNTLPATAIRSVTDDQRNHGASQFDPNLDSIHRLSRDLQELLALPTINHPI